MVEFYLYFTNFFIFQFLANWSSDAQPPIGPLPPTSYLICRQPLGVLSDRKNRYVPPAAHTECDVGCPRSIRLVVYVTAMQSQLLSRKVVKVASIVTATRPSLPTARCWKTVCCLYSAADRRLNRTHTLDRHSECSSSRRPPGAFTLIRSTLPTPEKRSYSHPSRITPDTHNGRRNGVADTRPAWGGHCGFCHGGDVPRRAGVFPVAVFNRSFARGRGPREGEGATRGTHAPFSPHMGGR